MPKLKLSSLQQKQALLRGLVFTLVTVIIWVVFSVFRSQKKTAISAELLQLAEPLNPNIDLQIIGRLEQKRTFTPEELVNFTIYRLTRTAQGEDRVVTELSETFPSPIPTIGEETEGSNSSPQPSPEIPTQVPTDIPTDIPTEAPSGSTATQPSTTP